MGEVKKKLTRAQILAKAKVRTAAGLMKLKATRELERRRLNNNSLKTREEKVSAKQRAKNVKLRKSLSLKKGNK